MSGELDQRRRRMLVEPPRFYPWTAIVNGLLLVETAIAAIVLWR